MRCKSVYNFFYAFRLNKSNSDDELKKDIARTSKAMRDSSLDYQAMCRGMAVVNGFDLKKMREEVKRERETEDIEEESAKKRLKKEEVKGMLQV